MNKASRGDGIPVELFQILEDDAVKYCIQYASKFGKLSSGPRTGKGQFSFPSQRKAIKRLECPFLIKEICRIGNHVHGKRRFFAGDKVVRAGLLDGIIRAPPLLDFEFVSVLISVHDPGE